MTYPSTTTTASSAARDASYGTSHTPLRPPSTKGLSDAEAQDNLRQYGENCLPQVKQKPLVSRWLKNLGDPVIRILLGVLLLNLLFLLLGIGKGDVYETIGIAVSVLLATSISTLSEHRSETAFARLSCESESSLFRVRRSGRITAIPIEQITVGDVVLLSAGEMIPADGRILSGSVTVNQSALTGESREVLKSAGRGRSKENLAENDPASPFTLFRGCTVLLGECEMEILRVGGATFLGEISREVQTETRDSPLKLRLEKLARQISVLGYIVSGLVAVAYLFNVFVIDAAFAPALIRLRLMDSSFVLSSLLHALMLALTVIVVAVPEGLPLMVAVVLSSNMHRMVRDRVLVRTATGIETAGSMNLLFTDKTGTLTEGKLSVGGLLLGDGTPLSSPKVLSKHTAIGELYALSAIKNTSSTLSKVGGKQSPLGGNGTEQALLSSVLQAGLPLPRGERIDYLPFDSGRKLSAATVMQNGRRITLLKGAPERLLPHANSYLAEDGRILPIGSAERLKEAIGAHTEKGERVLLLAYTEYPCDRTALEEGKFPALTVLSAVILRDKIRREAPKAVKDLRAAGIHVVMVTGDNRSTAAAIAEKCGILKNGVDTVLTGEELSHLSDVRLRELLPRLGVVARALPGDKSRLVAVAQEAGRVVGMTGDGINDAPALKRADIGFSMGSGTQVARDAGDVIILDNNLASIARAVLYGRTIFSSIRKFITLQLTMNLSAMGVTVICPFIGIESPITVVQMLWINLIMDTLGGLAFAGEAPMKRYMNEPPKKREEPIVNRYMLHQILLLGGFTVLLSLFFFRSPQISTVFRKTENDLCRYTAFFAFFIFASVFNCFNCRSDRLSLLSGIGENRAFLPIMLSVATVQILFVYLGGSVLRTVPLLTEELVFTLLLSLLVLPADLLRKLCWRLSGGRKGF